MTPDAFARARGAAVRPLAVQHYGAFVWLELDDEDLANVQVRDLPFEEVPAAYTLDLGGQRFDPTVEAPVLAEGWQEIERDGPDFQLVQLRGPARQVWLQDIQAGGLEIVEYIPPHTYVVWGKPRARDALKISANDRIRWAGPMAPAYRVLPRWQALDDRSEAFKVMLFRGADTDGAVAAIEDLGGRVTRRLPINADFEVCNLTIAGARLREAAQVPGVYTVQPVPTDGGARGEMSNQVNVNNVDGANLAFPGYADWLATVGLSGEGVVIANVDQGINDTHPDLVNRMLPCIGETCGYDTASPHGSHTAGIMAADGITGAMDGLGFLHGQGVAPGAQLVEQLFNPFYSEAGGMTLLMQESLANGAQVSGNSWGPAGSPRGYDIDTKLVDIGVRDADPDTAGNQALLYVVSIMNGYGGTSTQGTPDEAKNTITVGSTKMQSSGGQQLTDIDDLSINTAHGPALDGRNIPHLVAPGCSVDSTGLGTGYYLQCGTSMASPNVSGGAALFIEYYRILASSTRTPNGKATIGTLPPDEPQRAGSLEPSPAMIKAAFLVVARDLAGNRDADGGILGHPFDSKQGWGRFDLQAVLDPALHTVYFDHPRVFNGSGDEWTMSLAADDPDQPMRFMLVWTDAPGHGLGGSTPAWNNDLNLIVEADGQIYRGNDFGLDGWSQAGGAADGMNNTEGVFLGPASPTSVRVRIVAANINSDGIPGFGDGTDQDFSLACYNCRQIAIFTLTSTPSPADVCAPDPAVVSVDVGQVMGFSEPVTLSAGGVPPGASVSFAPNPVTPPGTSILTIEGTDAVPPGRYAVDITGTATTATVQSALDLRIFDQLPASPAPTAPADGSVEVDFLSAPAFSWTGVSQGATYDWQLATELGFASLVDSVTGWPETTVMPAVALEPGTEYFWRVRASNACGDGAYSQPVSFTTRTIQPILLVDDDDNGPDVRSFYAGTLDALGETYDVWDTGNSDNEPSAQLLGFYDVVIWFTGAAFDGPAGPGASGEAALASFLDAGHCLFISSQDYLYDKGIDQDTPNAFMESYLGASVASTSDVTQTTVSGAGEVFGSIGPVSLAYPFDNYSDKISPDGTAVIAFSGNKGDAAILKNSGVYRASFWGFPFEAIPTSEDREAAMAALLTWCADTAPAPPLPLDSVQKNRYIEFVPSNGGRAVSFEVSMTASLYFPGSTGPLGWVGQPDANGVARIVDTPVVLDSWPDVVRVGDCEIVPVATYEIRAVSGAQVSSPLVLKTIDKPSVAYWGDCTGPFEEVWPGPDGVANFEDVTAAIRKFQELGVVPPTTWVDVHGAEHDNPSVDPPDYVVNFSDVQQIIFGFQGKPYSFSDPANCP